jgi:mRNA interferase RelE/StbE
MSSAARTRSVACGSERRRLPRRVGKPLRVELTGIWSARRGTYRILYRIHDDTREVIVLRIEHRRDVYRHR